MGERKWSEVKGDFRRARASATVCARADLAAELEALQVRWEQAKADDQTHDTAADEPQAPKLMEQMRALRQQMLDSQVTFVFEALSRKRDPELISEHPPSEEQKEQARELKFTVMFNPVTYVPALLHETCVEPAGMTVQDWQQLCEDWSEGEVAKLYNAATSLNKGAMEVPKLDGDSAGS